MELLKKQARPSSRVNRGNVLLANTHRVDTTSVQARLDAFADLHSRFLDAHNKVEAAEALKKAEVNSLELLDGDLSKAIDALSAALLLDGEPRRNPFERFADLGPGKTTELSYGECARAVQELVMALRRSHGLSVVTMNTADKAEQAAIKVEEALPGLELRRTYLGLMRRERDSLIPEWDSHYLALRHLTKSLIEQRDLYAALFPDLHKGKKRTPSKPQSDGGDSASAHPGSTGDPPSSPPVA